MPTLARILELTPVAGYLASNDVAKGSLFRGGSTDPRLPGTIYMVYKVVKRIYDEDPVYPNLDIVGNYLYELIQKYAFKAAAIVDGNNGGQIAPPTPGSGAPEPYDFEVPVAATADAPIIDGQSSITLNGTNGTRDFRNFNIIFARGGIQQSTINQGSYYSWNRVTGQFECFPAAVLSEQFIITPV